MPANIRPSLVKKLTALFGLASLAVLSSVPGTAQMEANSREVANNTQTQQQPLKATPGVNLVAQRATTGLRNIPFELALADDAFSTLTTALRTAGLTSTLASGTYTVFAPTDEAFRALPRGTVQNLLEPRNRARLTRILTYHVVRGNIKSFTLRPGTVTRLTTLAGQPLTVRVNERREVFINGNKVIMADIAARNGTIHGISGVLLP